MPRAATSYAGSGVKRAECVEIRSGPQAAKWLVTYAGALTEFRGKAMDREAVHDRAERNGPLAVSCPFGEVVHAPVGL